MGPLVQIAALAASSWVVSAPVANMHSVPDAGADVVSQSIHGTTVAELDTKSGWVRVETPDRYKGWMKKSMLKRSRGVPYGESGKVALVASLFANVYSEPDVTEHSPFVTLPFESRIEILDEPDAAERRWIKIRLAGGREGWIQRGDVNFDSGPASVDETIALSRRFTGLPYLWGGTSSFGFDCSGFTQMLCRRRGIQMPRDAHMQADWSGVEAVDCAERLPGDLLFFGESEERITHTGMYVGGDEFIHATAFRKPMVQVSSLGEPHWSDLLVACRRPKEPGR